VDCAIAANGKSSAASNAWRTTVTMKVRIMLNCGISNLDAKNGLLVTSFTGPPAGKIAAARKSNW
jgi:hypothetical protein